MKEKKEKEKEEKGIWPPLLFMPSPTSGVGNLGVA
jgi:hypothetical protein